MVMIILQLTINDKKIVKRIQQKVLKDCFKSDDKIFLLNSKYFFFKIIFEKVILELMKIFLNETEVK